eukprot:189916-Chlamydomonas_euryale.AAC.1
MERPCIVYQHGETPLRFCKDEGSRIFQGFGIFQGFRILQGCAQGQSGCLGLKRRGHANGEARNVLCPAGAAADAPCTCTFEVPSAGPLLDPQNTCCLAYAAHMRVGCVSLQLAQGSFWAKTPLWQHTSQLQS